MDFLIIGHICDKYFPEALFKFFERYDENCGKTPYLVMLKDPLKILDTDLDTDNLQN